MRCADYRQPGTQSGNDTCYYRLSLRRRHRHGMEWHVLVSLGAALITFAGLSFQVRRERRLQRAEIKSEIQKLVDDLSARLIQVESRHDRDIQALHARVSDSRATVEQRLSKIDVIDGGLKEQTNIMRVIYEHMMKKGGR